jgi:hypothetical protein
MFSSMWVSESQIMIILSSQVRLVFLFFLELPCIPVSIENLSVIEAKWTLQARIVDTTKVINMVYNLKFTIKV